MYNSFKEIDGKIYCMKCAPKEPVDPEVKLAEEEAEEQFEKDMADVGTTAETARNEISETLATTIKSSKVDLGELANALGTVEKKPRKKRNRK